MANGRSPRVCGQFRPATGQFEHSSGDVSGTEAAHTAYPSALAFHVSLRPDLQENMPDPDREDGGRGRRLDSGMTLIPMASVQKKGSSAAHHRCLFDLARASRRAARTRQADRAARFCYDDAEASRAVLDSLAIVLRRTPRRPVNRRPSGSLHRTADCLLALSSMTLICRSEPERFKASSEPSRTRLELSIVLDGRTVERI